MASEDNERLSNELADTKEVNLAMRVERDKIIEHMKEYEDRLKEYEQELGNRDEVFETHDKMRLELTQVKAALEAAQEKTMSL
jgi:hypothetical protein